MLELRAFMAEHAEQREALPEFFERVAALRGAPGVREDLFAFPGPFIRELVHFLDGIGLARTEIRRYGAISAAVGERPGYFPPGADVFVAHPPTGLEGLRGGRGRYLFTVSRLDAPKRIELLIAAMAAGERARRAADRRHRPRRGAAARAGRRRTRASPSPGASAAPSWPASTRAPARSPSSRSSRTSGSSRSRRCSRASR